MPRNASSILTSDWPVGRASFADFAAPSAPASAKKAPATSAPEAHVRKTRHVPACSSPHSDAFRRMPCVDVARNIAQDAARHDLTKRQLAETHRTLTSRVKQIFDDVRAGTLEVAPDVKAFHDARGNVGLGVKRSPGNRRTPAQRIADLRAYARTKTVSLTAFVAERSDETRTLTASAFRQDLWDLQAGSFEAISDKDRAAILRKMGAGAQAAPMTPVKTPVRKKAAPSAKAAAPAKAKAAPKRPSTAEMLRSDTQPAPAATLAPLVLTALPDGSRRVEIPQPATPETIAAVKALLD